VGLQTVFPKPLTIGTLAQLLTALPSILDAHTEEAYMTFVRLSGGQTEIGSMNPFAFHFGINSHHWDGDGLPMGFREWVHSITAPHEADDCRQLQMKVYPQWPSGNPIHTLPLVTHALALPSLHRVLCRNKRLWRDDLQCKEPACPVRESVGF